jgi:hypothetical protein
VCDPAATGIATSSSRADGRMVTLVAILKN